MLKKQKTIENERRTRQKQKIDERIPKENISEEELKGRIRTMNEMKSK